jgi:thymidylate synthase (FAD)
MPKNNELTPATLPMPLRFNEKPTTEFINNLDAMEVTLLNYPTVDQLIEEIIPFTNATWNDDPIAVRDSMSMKEKIQNVYDAFHFKYLPQSLETVNLTFLIKGIDLQTVTHLLRNRVGFTFSAECSGDKWWTHKRSLVPNSVQQSDEFYKRWQEITIAAKQLYCDMIDSKQISIMDARHILPRNLETYYLMHVNFLSLLNFLKQRIDKQIQPEEDNVLAYKLLLATIEKVPFAINVVNIHAPAMHYVTMARTGKATNLYFPDKDSDIFAWNENDFIYQARRDELNGTNENATNHFNEVLKDLEDKINEAKQKAINKLNTIAGEEICF